MISRISEYKPVRISPLHFRAQLITHEPIQHVKALLERSPFRRITAFKTIDLDHIPNDCWFEFSDCDAQHGKHPIDIIHQLAQPMANKPKGTWGCLALNDTSIQYRIMALGWTYYGTTGKQSKASEAVLIYGKNITFQDRILPSGFEYHFIELQDPAAARFILMKKMAPLR